MHDEAINELESRLTAAEASALRQLERHNKALALTREIYEADKKEWEARAEAAEKESQRWKEYASAVIDERDAAEAEAKEAADHANAWATAVLSRLPLNRAFDPTNPTLMIDKLLFAAEAEAQRYRRELIMAQGIICSDRCGPTHSEQCLAISAELAPAEAKEGK